MDVLITMLPLVLTANLTMSVVKFLAGASKNKVWLRGLLAVFSVVGAISASALSGEPIDFNLLTDWGRLILESLVMFFASHYSYRVIKEA